MNKKSAAYYKQEILQVPGIARSDGFSVTRRWLEDKTIKLAWRYVYKTLICEYQVDEPPSRIKHYYWHREGTPLKGNFLDKPLNRSEIDRYVNWYARAGMFLIKCLDFDELKSLIHATRGQTDNRGYLNWFDIAFEATKTSGDFEHVNPGYLARRINIILASQPIQLAGRQFKKSLVLLALNENFGLNDSALFYYAWILAKKYNAWFPSWQSSFDGPVMIRDFDYRIIQSNNTLEVANLVVNFHFADNKVDFVSENFTDELKESGYQYIAYNMGRSLLAR